MQKPTNTISEVGMAVYHLRTIEKYNQEFTKRPTSFRLRCNIEGEVFEIPLNDIIKKEISKFLEEKRVLNQKILDNNPEILKIIENDS